MSQSSDFLIIGGGINGLLLARELAQTNADVVLVEKGLCCREASWAGGGIVSPLYPWRYKPAITALSSWAQDFYPRLAAALIRDTGIDPQLRQTGLLMLDAGDEAEALQWAGENNRPMEKVDSEFVYQHESQLARGFSGGLWMPEVANVRNPVLGRALVADLQRRCNVRIYEQCQVALHESPVHQVTVRKVAESTGASGKESLPEHQVFNAGKIILSTGAWSGLLARRLRVNLEVEPVKGQMLLYKFPSPPIKSIVLTNGRYAIPRQDGHLLIGSTLEYQDFDKTITEEALLCLSESGRKLLPMLADMEPVKQWAGLRPAAPEGIPFIGKIPGFDNLYINAGQFRNGLVLAPASARLLADILLDRNPVVDPHPYAPQAH